MARQRWLGLILLMAAGIGCVPSLYPLYTEETVVFDPKLGGCRQTEKNEMWCFTRHENTNSYDLVIVENDQKRSYLLAHLVQIGDNRFLDLYPKQQPLEVGGWWEYHLLPVHTFYLVEASEPNLVLSAMMPDAMEKLLSEKPGLLKHEMVEDRLVLTASTLQLQAFLEQPEMVERVFGEPAALKPYQPPSER